MKPKLLLAVLIFLVLVQLGCTESSVSVETKKMASLNTTSYVFKLSLNKLRDTVVKLFDVSPMDDPILASIFIEDAADGYNLPVTFSPETADKPIFGIDYFKAGQNTNDVFLYPVGGYWNSPIYHHQSKPFLYTTSFAIQFKSVADEFKSDSTQETMLTVVAVNPKIVNGTKCCGPHGNYSLTQSVKPTTVEEYTLILYIAEKLGIKGLRPITLPK